MLSERQYGALSDIRDHILLAQQWTGTLDLASFAEDRLRFYAVTRCLEIVSEASRRLPPETLNRHPEYPWRQMRDAGNVYRHFYEGVAESMVWSTVQDQLPALLVIIEAELAS